MKAIRRWGLVGAFLAMLALPAVVQAQFNYVTNNGSITITGYTGTGGVVNIPGTINGRIVISIGDLAFAGCGSLTNVTIPDTVTSIENYAFADCNNLTNAVIGAGVTNIGVWAFAYCSSLASVRFQGDVPISLRVQFITFLDDYDYLNWFTGDTATIYYEPETTGWGAHFCGLPTVPVGYVWSYDSYQMTMTVTGYTGPGGDVTIPDMIDGMPVTDIGVSAFSSCTNLTSVAISGGIYDIGNTAFSSCTSLTNVTIGSGVYDIGNSAFANCTNLTSVTIGSGVNNIGNSAFSNCTSLTSVIIPASVTSIGGNAFAGCGNLTNVCFLGPPPSLNGGGWFAGDPAVVYYPLGTIGWTSSFGGLPVVLWELAVTVAANPVQGGGVAVGGYWPPLQGRSLCAAGQQVQLTAEAAVGWQFTSWSDGNTNSSRLITMPTTNVTYMANFSLGYTFRDDGYDEPIVVNHYTTGVEHVSQLTIMGYMGTGGVVNIPDAINGDPVTGIGNSAFSSNASLTSVTIPSSVTSIGNSAFANCTSLMSVTIGGGVSSIGSSAFASCTRLTGVYFLGNAPRLGSSAFSKDGNATVYYLPGTTDWGPTFGGRPAVLMPFNYTTETGTIAIMGYVGSGGALTIPDTINGLPVASIEDDAFSDCSSLSSIKIPFSVSRIGNGAFYNCSGLTSVTIPNSVTNIGLCAFGGCSRLTAIAVDTLDPCYSSKNGVLFDKSQTALVQCPGGKTGNYTVPDGVTHIGDCAFDCCSYLTNVTIGSGVTSIGYGAFENCLSLVSVTIPVGVNNIDDWTFYGCSSLANVTIPEGVRSIGYETFALCPSLVSITIPASVTLIDDEAFSGCDGLATVYFRGNAPTLGWEVFDYDYNATIHYLFGTAGWGTMCGDLPTVLWNPQVKTDSNFGVQAGCFGFTFTNAGSPTVVIEACTNLANAVWMPVATNTLTAGSSHFADPGWTNHPTRFYRFRMP